MSKFKEGQHCSILTTIGTKLKLKRNIGTKLNHFDTGHNYEMTCVKNKKKIKKIIKKITNWHVVLTLTLSGQSNGNDQIEIEINLSTKLTLFDKYKDQISNLT